MILGTNNIRVLLVAAALKSAIWAKPSRLWIKIVLANQIAGMETKPLIAAGRANFTTTARSEARLLSVSGMP